MRKPTKPAVTAPRKPWNTPRVIVAEADTTAKPRAPFESASSSVGPS